MFQYAVSRVTGSPKHTHRPGTLDGNAMEIVQGLENPSKAEYEDIAMDMVGVGGGVIVSVAGLEMANTELLSRGVPTWGVAVVDLLVSGLAFSGAHGGRRHAFLKKFLVGVGAGGFVETLSTAVAAFQGAK